MNRMTEINATRQMKRLWEHVAGDNPDLSPLMAHVKDSLTEAAAKADSGDNVFRLGLDRAANRIGRHVNFHNDPFLARHEGEWRVTNADLETWASLNLFGKRDYLPDVWTWFSNEITPALHGMRRWQTWERFEPKGVTAEHVALAFKLIWDLSLWRGDGVSLYVQGKRPLGNSGIEGDIADAVGWAQPWAEDENDYSGPPPEFVERCWDLFDELEFAVPAIIKAAHRPA